MDRRDRRAFDGEADEQDDAEDRGEAIVAYGAAEQPPARLRLGAYGAGRRADLAVNHETTAAGGNESAVKAHPVLMSSGEHGVNAGACRRG